MRMSDIPNALREWNNILEPCRIESTSMDTMSNTVQIEYNMPLDLYFKNLKYTNYMKYFNTNLSEFNIENLIYHIYANAEKGVIVVKWIDGEITKVTLSKDDTWDLEAGVNAAIIKRLYKSHTNFKNFITNNTTYIQSKKKGDK